MVNLKREKTPQLSTITRLEVAIKGFIRKYLQGSHFIEYTFCNQRGFFSKEQWSPLNLLSADLCNLTSSRLLKHKPKILNKCAVTGTKTHSFNTNFRFWLFVDKAYWIYYTVCVPHVLNPTVMAEEAGAVVFWPEGPHLPSSFVLP